VRLREETLSGMLLKAAFFVSGFLFLPPALILITKGLEGAQELLGAASFTKADLESPLFMHVMYIDAGKNVIVAAICFCAATLFNLSAQQITASLMIALDMWCFVVQVIAPVGPGVKPWPALDGLFSNPVLLPIVGGQIVLLTLGLLTSLCGDEKAKTN